MAGRKATPSTVRSQAVRVRLREEERAAFQQFAAALGQTPSRIIRRLIREAITGGPDYFKDELGELRKMRRELTAIGRNLNQLARAANQGGVVEGADVRRVVNACLVQTAAVKALYRALLDTVVNRTVEPLRDGWEEEKGA